MDTGPTEPTPEPASDKPKSLSVLDATWASLGRLEPAEKSERRVLSGSLIGVCLATMYTMLTIPRLNQPLRVALILFAVAVPLLIMDYFFSAARPKKGTDDLMLRSLSLAAWVIGDGIGVIAVVIGVGIVVWNLYDIAAYVFIATSIAGFILLIVSSIGIAIAVAWRRVRAEEKHKPSSEVADSVSLDP